MVSVTIRPTATDISNPIILGVGRGGTSFFAVLLKNLGYYLGDSHNPYHEDPRLYDVSATRYRIFQTEYSHYPRWGVKLPSMAFDIPAALTYFPNPCFVVVSRSPVSTILSMNRRSGHPVAPAAQLLFDAQQEIFNQVLSTSVPTILVDFEQCVQQPRAATVALTEFLHINDISVDDVTADLHGQTGYQLHRRDPAADVGKKLADVTDLYPVYADGAVINSCYIYFNRRLHCLSLLIDDFFSAIQILSTTNVILPILDEYKLCRTGDIEMLRFEQTTLTASTEPIHAWSHIIEKLDSVDAWWRARRIAAQRMLECAGSDADERLLVDTQSHRAA